MEIAAACLGDTMASVAARKKKIGRPRQGDEPKETISVRLAPKLIERLDALVGETRRSRSVESEIAIEKHLKELGYWPPPAEE